MNKLFISSDKVLSLKQDGRIYYDRLNDDGENNFSHFRVICNRDITENDVSQLDASIVFLVTTKDNDISKEHVIPVTLSQSTDIDDIFASDVVDVGSDVISGVGKMNIYVRFDGDDKLGMTNSVTTKIFDVYTNSSEVVYPMIGNDPDALDPYIERQSVLNERLGDLVG